MINLIPPNARKNLLTLYWARVVSVWGVLLGIAALIGGILLLPTYVLVSNQTNVYESANRNLADSASSFDVSAAELITANQQAQDILQADATQSFSDHVEVLEQLAGSVQILELNYAPNETGASFTLSGLAANRLDLVAFRDALSDSAQYSEVDLPISNLIKDSDIVFTMRFVATQDQTTYE